jgi:hypothetical protein
VTNFKMALDFALVASGKKAPAATSGADVASALSRQTAFPRFALTTGTGSAQGDGFVWTVRELAASASDTLDLYAGSSLFTPFGEVARFQTLKFVWVQQVANPDGSSNSPSISVGGAASNATPLWMGGTTNTCTIKGVNAVPFVQGDPAGITLDSTHKNLKVLNNSGTLKANYLIALAGVLV